MSDFDAEKRIESGKVPLSIRFVRVKFRRILRKLEQVKTMTKTFIQDDDGFRVTNPEGFVAVDKLKSDQYVKLVDRLEFSRQNFNAAKNWSKGA